MSTNGDLDLEPTGEPERDACILRAVLLGGGLDGSRWWTARELRAHMGPAWSERRIRHAASASEGCVVSGPGSAGYCAVERATREELREMLARLAHQADRMETRRTEMAAAWNSCHREPLDAEGRAFDLRSMVGTLFPTAAERAELARLAEQAAAREVRHDY